MASSPAPVHPYRYLALFLSLLIGVYCLVFLTGSKQAKPKLGIDLHESLRVGDRVHTTSGLQGTITGITADNVDLEIAPGVVTRWMKLAIRDRVEADVPEFEEAGSAARLSDPIDGDADRLNRD